jgi:POT family proton-dependent oligopeptide transporter
MLGVSFAKLSELIRNSNNTRIVLAAAFQRFGHYGIRSLLLIYLITEFRMSDQNAGQTYGIFYGSFFLTSLVGGYVGDTKLGYRSTGSLGMVLMLLAQLSLVVGQSAGTVIGLLLYSIGYGLFNPNMNAAVAELYHDDENLRSAAYTILYSGINLGAMMGPLVCGYIALRTHWRYGFLATIPCTLLGVILFAGAADRASRPPEGDSDDAGGLAIRGGKLFLIVAGLGLLGIIFAGVFDQMGSSVTLLVHRHVHRDFSTFQIPAGYVQAINPFLVILIGPVLSFIIKQGTFSKTRVGKMKILILGFVCLGTGFLLLSIGSLNLADIGSQVHFSWAWVFSAILLTTFGELLFAPTAVSLIAGMSSIKRRGLVMGAWSATFGVGIYLSGAMSGLMGSTETFSKFFALSASSCLLACLLLLFTIWEFKRHEAFA